MNDDPILDALRRMPRVAASPGFTERVARAAAAPANPVGAADSGLGWSRGWALFASCLILVSVVSAWQWERRERKREWLGELQALRAESRSLEGELDALRAAEQAPLVHLGGDDRVDLILDLEAVSQARSLHNERLARARIEAPPPTSSTQGDTL